MSLPLEGIVVVELGHSVAAPCAGLVLGDLGADVVKIEKPGEGEIGRGMPPHFFHGESVYFISMGYPHRGGGFTHLPTRMAGTPFRPLLSLPRNTVAMA